MSKDLGRPTLWKMLAIIIPGCFLLGAGMEYFMIKVPVGGETFYSVAKRKEAERRLARASLPEPELKAPSESNVAALPAKDES
ncbi:hypothetical protein CCYA_CCYA03G1019 [Cyanidiococcus yangmingshanensis]|nr:hypothetical protein CCYA_CCYA03G1019 [Cyanidiococcus yangmingshanensis]